MEHKPITKISEPFQCQSTASLITQIRAAKEYLRGSNGPPDIFKCFPDKANSALLSLWDRCVGQNSYASFSVQPSVSTPHKLHVSTAPLAGTASTKPSDPTAVDDLPTVQDPHRGTQSHVSDFSSPENPDVSPGNTCKTVPEGKSISNRRVYTRHHLYQLRHTHRLALPGNLTTLSRRSDTSLPILPFTPSETLTADVLLVGKDARLKFSDLQLSPDLLSALPAAGFDTPSPIQLRTIPRARLGCDVIAHAKSGTGKTAAYALATLDAHLLAKSTLSACPHTLVLVPTRELAFQTAGVFSAVSSHILPPLSILTFVGGISEHGDVASLTSCPPHIVVGTPGRVRALVDSTNLSLHAVSIIVLDEADRLLSRGFQDDVGAIVNSLTSSHQTLAFSATFPPWLRRTLMSIMRNPAYITDVEDNVDLSSPSIVNREEVAAAQQAVLRGVRQSKILVPYQISRKKGDACQAFLRKTETLVGLLQTEDFNFCIVFCNYKKRLSRVETLIRKAGFSCKRMCADVRQKERNAVMDAIKKGSVQVVIATDLLARGIDIKVCDVVAHLDVPTEVETYLHRVGRAGRFGRQGLSYLLFSENEEKSAVASLESALGYKIQHIPLPEVAHGSAVKNDDREEALDKRSEDTSDRQNNGNLGENNVTCAVTRVFKGSIKDSRESGAWSMAIAATADAACGDPTTEPDGDAKMLNTPRFAVRADSKPKCENGLMMQPRNQLSTTHFNTNSGDFKPLSSNAARHTNLREGENSLVYGYKKPSLGVGQGCTGMVGDEVPSMTNVAMNYNVNSQNSKRRPTDVDEVLVTELRTDAGSEKVGCQEQAERENHDVGKNKRLRIDDCHEGDFQKSAHNAASLESLHGDGAKWEELLDDYPLENDEDWEEFARSAWDLGYREAYQRAYRLASELRQRLHGSSLGKSVK